MGSTHLNMHLCPGHNPLPFDRWMETYGYTYQQMIEEDVDCIMTTHIALDCYDNEKHDGYLPIATFSKKVTTDLLKGELGFKGAVVTDALVMGGMSTGDLVAETTAPCGTFSFEEVIEHPTIIEPYSLFGKSQTFKSTYTARGDVGVLTIDKQYIYTELDRYEVFRMNFFNLLCSKVEQQHEYVWSIDAQQLEGRLIHLVRGLCTSLHGVKVLKVKMIFQAYLKILM